ncbi:hypothetical protein DFH11DRAFT_356438 [Phellopilus nigrolimitatus]|nr:hypothetical protein DFH11DRAFT_356438 [Phellopilus nigrolimitatus]
MAGASGSFGQGGNPTSEHDDDFNVRSTSPKTETQRPEPDLKPIESRYDKLDHHKLDELTIAYFQKATRGLPAFLNAEWILMIVAETCHRLNSNLKSYSGATETLSHYGTALEKIVLKAHVGKDYKAVRNLVVLQKNPYAYVDVDHSTDDKQNIASAVKLAWKVPYQGRAHLLLYETVATMTWNKGLRSNANSLFIVQSTGTGKSRTVHEHSKLVFTIPFNLTADEEKKGFPYPFPDNAIREHFHNAPRAFLPARLYFLKFLFDLFSAVLEEVETLKDWLKPAKTYGDVADAWSFYLEEKGRNNLYRRVVRMEYEKFLEEEEIEVKDESDPAVFNLIAKQTQNKISGLISFIGKLVGDEKCKSPDARVVVSFDEAQYLTNISIPTSADLPPRTLYDAFCAATNEILPSPVFFLFLSTQFTLWRFVPPQTMFLLDRIISYSDQNNIRPPFTELPFDCFGDEPLIRPGEKTLKDVSTIHFMSQFGRPMFSNLMGAMVHGTELHMVNLARAKLIASSKPDIAEMTDDAKLAVLAVRLLLDFNTSQADRQARMVRLVQNHMAIAFSIPKHREALSVGYPSEPILAEAAARQMNVMRNSCNAMSIALLLQEFVERGLVDKGERGELVARLIFTLAYDEAAEAYERDTSENRKDPVDESSDCPFYSRGVPLKYFIVALFGKTHAEHTFKSHPDNVRNGQTFEQAFERAWVRFTHFQRAGNSSVISTEAAWAAAARAMAFQSSSGHAGMDIFIPVVLRDEKLQEEIMTGILVHLNDRVSAETKVRAEIDEQEIGFFPSQPANGLNANTDSRPYITIVMELGVQPFYRTQAENEAKSNATRADRASSPAEHNTTSRNVATSPRRPAVVAHPRYSIFAIGCSPSVYNVVDDKDVYATLLSSRHILQEHSRQTPDSLSAVRRLKPFWIAGPECFDWVGETKLSSVDPPEEPVAEGVYTGNELRSVVEQDEDENAFMANSQ